MSYDNMKADARRVAISNPQLVKNSMIVDGLQPLHVALTLLSNLCARDLRTGTDHIYRGVVGITGLGKRELFVKAQHLMAERGFITKEDADEAWMLLSQEIREAG